MYLVKSPNHRYLRHLSQASSPAWCCWCCPTCVGNANDFEFVLKLHLFIIAKALLSPFLRFGNYFVFCDVQRHIVQKARIWFPPLSGLQERLNNLSNWNQNIFMLFTLEEEQAPASQGEPPSPSQPPWSDARSRRPRPRPPGGLLSNLGWMGWLS